MYRLIYLFNIFQINNSQFVYEKIKSLFIKRFCKQISQLILRINKLNYIVTIIHMILSDVVSQYV